MAVDINNFSSEYKDELKDYFVDLELNKNNFFTDISNYISYETGQPTHCYDLSKIGKDITLDYCKEESPFRTLLNKDNLIQKNDLVFTSNNKIINLAGVMGGLSSSCTDNTKSVIIECAFFKPELIIGKSVYYDIKSDASYKFERGVDPSCHEYVLRRFLKIIDKHAEIANVRIFSNSYRNEETKFIDFNEKEINKIIGHDINKFELEKILKKFNFVIERNTIRVPSYRHDITNINDIAEEVARAIGYDNIEKKPFKITAKENTNDIKNNENSIKKLLVDNGFCEVINNPFVGSNFDNSIKIDNPLDSNRRYLRVNLQQSLVDNLLYNERRQQDSIKLFEVSNIYDKSDLSVMKRVIGIIASGRVEKNYIDFSKKITNEYIKSILGKYINNLDFEKGFVNISRSQLDTKLKNHISYIEIEINNDLDVDYYCANDINTSLKFHQYEPISEFPSSTRDLSFSINNFSNFTTLENLIMRFNHDMLKHVFLFDYYNNEAKNEIKAGFRFTLQSKKELLMKKK